MTNLTYPFFGRDKLIWVWPRRQESENGLCHWICSTNPEQFLMYFPFINISKCFPWQKKNIMNSKQINHTNHFGGHPKRICVNPHYYIHYTMKSHMWGIISFSNLLSFRKILSASRWSKLQFLKKPVVVWLTIISKPWRSCSSHYLLMARRPSATSQYLSVLRWQNEIFLKQHLFWFVCLLSLDFLYELPVH